MTEVMYWKKNTHDLHAFGRVIPCSCDVRNEVNGRRLAGQVVKSIPAKLPYQPRRFPTGRWRVSIPLPRTSKELAPYFIPTDAFQYVPVWVLKDDKYFHATNEQTKDEGYGLHYSEYQTTLGCIRITNKTDLLWLVDQILAYDGEVYIEVTV